MTDGIRQFKINGKQVELNDKKSINRDLYVQDATINSIFDKLNKADANGNIDDVLDEKELKDFQQKIIDAAGEDGDLSSEEAKSLLESLGLKDVDTNKFFGFIQSMFSKEDAKVKEEVSDAVEQPQESEVGEDEQVTKGIIVQNGESPATIAKKFGVSLQDLLDANKDALKGKGDKKYFLVGQEIVIPRKIDDEELATLTAGRKSAQETTGDYAQQAAVREQRAAEIRERRAQEEAELKALGLTERATGKVEAHYAKTPNKPITLKKIGNAKNGRSICVDKNGNYVVVAKDGTILKTDFVKNPEKYEQARKLNEEVKTRNGAKGLAKEFYQIADNNSGLNSINKMQKLLDTKVSAKNITQFLDEYDKFKQGDSSIIDTITSEVGASGTIQQKKVLTTLMDKLSQAARQAGVSEAEIKKANADFLKAYNAEYTQLSGAFRRTNPKDMEKAMDSLRGNILAKQNGTGDVDSAEAIKQFKDLARNEHNSAVKDFNKAREEEGWTAKVGDTVCGWFGCNTIEDLNKKLGANTTAVKKLVNSKTEAEFRKNYKEIFGVEFDPNKISARQNAIEKYSLALNCNNTVKAADKVLKHSDSWGYSDIKTAIRNNFKYDNETIDQIINGYAQQKGLQNPTDADKKAFLVQFLNDTKTNARREFTNIAQGKSLDQMGKDIELITRSAFGTNDIVKDVIQFNENQQMTEMVTEAGFEIAGTIALQFVPGLGQMAAARLAVSAARWGTKAVKVVRYAQKAEKVFSTVNKFQKGEAIANATTRTARVVNRGVQIGSQMVNTGVATAGVDLSNGKSVKETTKKALMNMSFAGVGASSSILAPKLMQAFGIADKALATEIAEEIINAAGSYGITKLEGGEYGQTDAFVDFASGLIISRISHVGGSKPTVKPQGATTPDVPVAPKVDTPATPAPKAKPETVKADVKPAETPEVVVKPEPQTNPEPLAPTSKKDAVADDVPLAPAKTDDEVPLTPVKVDDEVPTPEVETPVTPQPKNEFETAEVPTTAKGMDDLSFDELFGDLNASESEYLSIERKRLMEESGFSEETLADIDFETAVALKDLCKDCDTIMLRYQDAVNNEHFVFERDIYNKPTEYLETDPNAKRMALLILSSNPKYQAIFDRIGANKFIKAETEGLHLPESSTKVKPQENNGNKVHTDAPDAVSNFNDLSFEDIFGDLDSAAGETELRNDRIKNLKSKGFDESLLQEIDTESLSFIDEMATEIDKYEYLRNGALTKEDFNLDDIFAHKDYTPEQAKILRSKLQQNPKYKDFFNKDVPDNSIAAPIDNPAPTQPKYTKEFEPAHNDTPVSSEIIDQRLGADNPELHDMGEYYRDLETKEFEPNYEKREVSAKTIDEQFENPELLKLNEEFASGNSMLQKQAAVESAIENLNHQNYSPEYVESIREKIKEIFVGNPEMEKSYNELLDMAANDASLERANLIREKEYIERTYGTHKSAQESAQVFSDHLEQVNATKEDDYIRRTHENPSGKSAAESAEVFGKELDLRDKVKATDEQLHQKTVLDGDELFERVTHSNNSELQKLGAQYKKLEAQQEELQQQVERLKEQIRRKAQTSADEIDGRFNRSNPELDIMNTKYRSLELQQEKLRAQVEKLKQQMREKVSVNADNIDARLNQRTGDYEDLAADLRNREAVGQRAKKELELEKAEQAAVEREQAYIDRTYGATHKSASESADVFNADIAKKEAAAKAKEEAKKPKKTLIHADKPVNEIELQQDLARLNKYYKKDISLNTNKSQKEMVYDVLDNVVYAPPKTSKPTNKKLFLKNVLSNSDNKIKNLSVTELTSIVEQGIPGFTQLENKNDIIILLKNIVDNPEYKQLSHKSQTMLKFAVLLNNFDTDALKSILKEYNIPDNISKRINSLRWNNNYEQGLAVLRINDEDSKISELLTEEKSKIDSFKAKVYNQDNVNIYLEQTRSRVQLVYPNQVANKKQMPELTIKGMVKGDDVTVKYLDLTSDDTAFDLTQYGFEEGSNKDKLRMLTHMFGNNNSDPLSSVINILNATKDNNGGITLSTTFRGITGDTFSDAGKIGVIVSGSEVTSSSAALHHGFKSGLHKNDDTHYQNLMGGIYDKEHKGYFDALKAEEAKSYLNEFEARDKATFFLADNLIKKLNSMGYNITDKEYHLIVEQLSSKKYISNIKNDIKIGDITIKGTDLQEAIKETQDLLIKTGDNTYNEVLVNAPKIQAIAISDFYDINYLIKNHPALLIFAEKYGIPIIKIK